ncbi:hypothetical protein GCM10009789_48670 [Kribbella sancticallisti]|uniref:Uncharacterized protein n=1 Tax=Kribbella sancticallisti TaxID=460087 RepID=A0ABN2DWZ6_9ACTN
MRRIGVDVMHDRIAPDQCHHPASGECAVGIEDPRVLQWAVAAAFQPVLRGNRRARVIAQRDRHQQFPLGEEVEPGVLQQRGRLVGLVRGHCQPDRPRGRCHLVRQALDDGGPVVEREQLPVPIGETEYDLQR